MAGAGESGPGVFRDNVDETSTSRNDESDTDTVSGEGKAEAKSVARTARKSMSRAVDRVQATFDAAGIPLPDTPLA